MTKYASKDELLKGSDLAEKDVKLETLGITVKIRALSAKYSNLAQSEAVVSKQVGRDQISTVDKGKMEVIQVFHALVEPKLDNLKEAEAFAENCGPAFGTLIEEIDAISDIDKDAIERTEARFPVAGASEEGVEVGGSGTGGEGAS